MMLKSSPQFGNIGDRPNAVSLLGIRRTPPLSSGVSGRLGTPEPPGLLVMSSITSDILLPTEVTRASCCAILESILGGAARAASRGRSVGKNRSPQVGVLREGFSDDAGDDAPLLVPLWNLFGTMPSGLPRETAEISNQDCKNETSNDRNELCACAAR